MISIIVPIYNSERCLSRCIESIIAQSNSNWELILINDGSTDESGKICDEYSQRDSRISVFHGVNNGVSAARNIGLEYAKGEWVTFCDSDDELKSTAIECYSYNMIGDVDVIRGGFERIHSGESTIITMPNTELSNKEQIVTICHRSGYEAYLWNSCFRKSTIGNIRFDKSISWCEDHLFTFQVMGRARKVLFMSECVYRYFAPIKKTNFEGTNLSSKYIDPHMILDEAAKERQIKESFLSGSSIEGRRLIDEEYFYKVNLAIRYAVMGDQYIKAVTIASSEGLRGIRKLISIFYHTKITTIIKRILNIYPQ